MYHSSSLTFTQCKQIDRFSVTPGKGCLAAWSKCYQNIIKIRIHVLVKKKNFWEKSTKAVRMECISVRVGQYRGNSMIF